MRTDQSIVVTAVAVLVMVMFLHGCETLKGAGNGMKKDLSHLQGMDNWVRENLW